MLLSPLPSPSIRSSVKLPGPYDIPLYVETAGDPQAEQVVLLVHGGFQSP
jgi:hypothetical protein